MTFWIREGDTLPAIVSTLIDAEGKVVDLTNATAVQLELRDRATGVVAQTLNGDFPLPKTDGKVRYAWASGSTDTADDYAGHWLVTFTGGAIQSYPTDAPITIIIASKDGSVGSYSAAVLFDARRSAGEVGDTTYTDNDIATLLAKRNGDVAAVAYDIWTYKAADAANLVDMSDAGSSRSLGALYKQCLEMAKFWGDRSATILDEQRATPRRGARTRGIERV